MPSAEGLREYQSLLWEDDLPQAFRPPGWPDLEGNAAFRLKILRMCEDNPEAWTKVKQVCAMSPYFWLQTFGYTNDPRRKPATLPFVMFPCQVDLMQEALYSIFTGEDYFIDKSRDMGASWIMVSCGVYIWSYWPSSSILFGSFKEERVDRKRGSLLKMADTLIRYMPPQILPSSWDPSKHRTFMSIRNIDGDSVIEGEATNPEFGRGDRKTFVLFDEHAYWGDKQAGMDTEAWEGTADVTNCRVSLSTPHGVATKQHQLKELFESGGMRGMRLWWWMDPRKNEDLEALPDGSKTSTWYREQKKRRSAEYMAQEVDIKYLGTGSPAFPLSMEFLFGRRKELVQRIHDGKYGKAYEFIYETEFDDRAYAPIGKRIRGIQPVELPEAPRLVEQFINQRDFQGTPGWIWIFEEPEKDWRNLYIVTNDQSEGLAGGDFQTISVQKRAKQAGQRAKQVATWRGKVPPDILAEIVVWFHTKYNGGFMVPEAGPAGQSSINFMREIMKNKFLRNVYHSETTDKDQKTKTTKIGYNVSHMTKKPLVGMMQTALHSYDHDINCLQTVVELFNYEKSGNRYAARPPYHDDAAIAHMLAIAADLSGQIGKPIHWSAEERAAREARRRSFEEAVGFNDGLCV